MEFWVLFFTICLVCATMYIYGWERLRNGGRSFSLKPPNKTQYLKGVEKHMRSIRELSNDFRSTKISRRQCKILRLECESKFKCLMELPQSNQSPSILKELFCAIRRALKLMQDCCSENWLLKAVEFGKCERHLLEILLDLHRLSIVVAQSIDIADGAKLRIDEARELDTADLMSMLEEDDDCPGYCLADQLGESPSVIAPDAIGSYVTQFNFSKSKCIHKGDDESDICVFPVRYCDTVFVIKTRLKQPDGEEDKKMRKEAKYMKKCRHPYAVALLGYWERTTTNGPRKPLILMEFMECDLDSIIKRNKSWWWWPWDGTGGFPALIAINLVLPVAKVMKYLHEIEVVHLDLKPKNILFSLVPGKQDHPEDVSVKLADFGEARKAEGVLKGKVGTPGYMDPDMFWWPIKKGSVDLVKADVFSFGLVFAEVLTGLSPLEALDCMYPKEFYRKLQSGEQLPLPRETPEFVKSIVESCLKLKPAERPSFDEICGKLQYTERLLLDEQYM